MFINVLGAVRSIVIPLDETTGPKLPTESLAITLKKYVIVSASSRPSKIAVVSEPTFVHVITSSRPAFVPIEMVYSFTPLKSSEKPVQKAVRDVSWLNQF